MFAFAAAVDILFEDPNMAADALYITVHGEVSSVRVIRRTPDPDIAFSDTRIVSNGSVFDIRVSEVAAPRPRDQVRIGTAFFEVQGEPVLDDLQLVWILDARPVA